MQKRKSVKTEPRRVIVKDGRREVWDGNRMIAYVDQETGLLCILNQKGYVVNQVEISRDSEILPNLPK